MSRKIRTGKTNILLIGFQDQDNLGLRSLMSSVMKAGFSANIVTYPIEAAQLMVLIASEKPDIIGFSLIFQYLSREFGSLITTLRNNGIEAHITMGGHYPSFEYEEILHSFPGLDSIVRFEGEATLVELMQKISIGADWKTIRGIAYSDEGKIVATPLRPLINLEKTPLPYRGDIDYSSQEMPMASILGSRGCPMKCSFCSIRPFYETPDGPIKRYRPPSSIVEEIEQLYHKRGVTIFLFQDDDFLAGGRRARDWATDIAEGIRKADLVGKVAFKISCRSDEIRKDTIACLKAGGLTHVYMGVESGDEQGLRNMNKKLTPDTHLRAGEILRSLDISFDFGFMLLDPYSTFESTKNNIDFLEEFTGDGWSAASFCRMLPYAGTPIKEKLVAENRLKGTAFEPDYHFLEPRLDYFYEWMLGTFYERNFTNTGLCHILKILLFKLQLKLNTHNRFTPSEKSYARHLTAVANGVAFYTLKSAITYIQGRSLKDLENDHDYLKNLTRNELAEEQKLINEASAFYSSIVMKR
ncbi:MAG: B12-binding domain-containing radical SAM protein [FCB group bacterium]|nr:B12-binding domain-containing radical SAM protein [FCB group bacterium]